MHGADDGAGSPGGTARPGVKVTLVVAVYNPGDHINELLESIDRQSLPPEEFEVVLADDDSTDGSRERLQEWAAARTNVRVLHNTPNSGWPGRPRNLALDAAVGEFVFFADNDDRLAPRGLEWMYDYAVACDADVVIAKEVGVGRPVNREIFRRNLTDARLGEDPILNFLTPHKLFRTEMVRSHGIRFPEGRVRLEDHFFVVASYFAARRIAVLADKPCYYWMRRPSEGVNASIGSYDPVRYFSAVERTLDLVETHTEPGTFREQLYANWYERKMLTLVRGRILLKKGRKHQKSMLAEIRRVSSRFGLGDAQWPWLGALGRVNSHLLSHGSLDDLRAVAEAIPGATSRVTLEQVEFTDDDQLRLRLRGRLVHPDETPVRTVAEGEAYFWDLSGYPTGVNLPRIEVTDLRADAVLDAVLCDRRTGDIRFARSTSTLTSTDAIEVGAEILFDLRQVVDDHPRGGLMDLSSRLVALGWAPERRIPVGQAVLPSAREIGGLVVRPYATHPHANLSLDIGPPETLPARLRRRARPLAGPIRRRGRSVVNAAVRRTRGQHPTEGTQQ